MILSFYGYRIWRRYDKIWWSSHFWVKVHVFSTFFNNKSRSCGLNHAKWLFMFYFSSRAQKKISISRGLTWFLILGKIQDGGQDGDYCWWRHRPPAAPLPIKYISSCREDQRLSTKGKVVSKCCNTSKTLGGGGGSIHPLLYHSGGMNLHLRPRVKSFHPWKICTSFETTYWLYKQKNVSKAAMSVIPEYEFSPATVKLPSLHDKRYRLEVYANRFCHLRPPGWLRQTLHSAQNLWMSNMRFRHGNCS